MDIVLASSSPRRKQLMGLISDDFITADPDINEIIPTETEPDIASEFLATAKAEKVAQKYPDSLVIGCDTTVIYGSEIFGKPGSKEDAREILKTLSGVRHKVITGCCIIYKSTTVTFSELTEVDFFPLSDAEINEYIKTGEPFDKAGAYGIQGQGALLVKKIDGDYYNVVGMPIARLSREIKKLCEKSE